LNGSRSAIVAGDATGREIETGAIVKRALPDGKGNHMNEQEFDSRFSRPFVRADAIQADALARRCATLAAALWGNADHLQRQLAAPHPEIPQGFELSDFQELQQRVLVFQWFAHRRFPTFPDAQHPQLWEARREVLRRAIEYLEDR
jgi:hypothetical protein